MSLPEKDDYNVWREKLKGRIAVCFGGRVAEDLVFGDISAGAQNDIEQATNLAKVMVCELGMSEKVGPIKYTSDQENPFLGREFRVSSDVSERTLDVINCEVRRIIDEQYARARELIVHNRRLLDLIADGLLAYETLSGDELAAIIRGDDLAEFRAARARARASETAAREAIEKTKTQDEPDMGLAGAEGPPALA
jgi:cell division protease FtsH